MWFITVKGFYRLKRSAAVCHDDLLFYQMSDIPIGNFAGKIWETLSASYAWQVLSQKILLKN